MNALSHRAEHRVAAEALRSSLGRPTGDAYAVARKKVARRRRAEQRLNRIAAGTDRATNRASL